MSFVIRSTAEGAFKWFDRDVEPPQPRFGRSGYMRFSSVEEAQPVIEPLVRLGHLIKTPEIVEASHGI